MTIAQVPGLTRTDLQRSDLSIPGREMIQNRVDIAPDAPIRHKHPGEEIIYVLEGTLEYSIDGQEPATFNAGEVLLVPSETVHSVRNIGSGNAAELATYIVEKGKPLLVIVE
ncbi:MAG TPA: cupin domain-containing protein [Solirubrobacteraceae bacterium]|nr:cupin domain-containing protein [Solirubrobacteraceae bacterium]